MKPFLFSAVLFAGVACALPGFAAEPANIAPRLAGKLIEVREGEIVEAELTGDPEYFVLYHSASW